MLAAAPHEAVRYAVMVCTVVTTVCGIWLAYGEPPNLIMKANLASVIWTTPFFCVTARPAAIASYLVIAWQLRRRLRGGMSTGKMDVIDANAEDVRFLQATRHGEVITPVNWSKITLRSWATERSRHGAVTPR